VVFVRAGPLGAPWLPQGGALVPRTRLPAAPGEPASPDARSRAGRGPPCSERDLGWPSGCACIGIRTAAS